MSEAVLLMAYGSPERLEQVESYYTHIRGGRPPSPDLLAELLDRYRAIGGRSPLMDITRRQAAALADLLAGRGAPVPVYVGMKHAPPFIAETVRQMAAEGMTHAVGLALAPHYSRMSVGAYLQAVEEARPSHLACTYVETWHDHPAYLQVVARRLRAMLDRFDAPPAVVFTAHSLPEHILTWGDPYPGEVRGSAEAVARIAGVDRWTVAYQSAGRTAEAWLGPDLRATLERLAEAGERAVVVCPVGFVTDHLEVLYDVDVEARQMAAALGLRLERTAIPNDAPDFIAALADLVRPRLPAAAQ